MRKCANIQPYCFLSVRVWRQLRQARYKQGFFKYSIIIIGPNQQFYSPANNPWILAFRLKLTLSDQLLYIINSFHHIYTIHSSIDMAEVPLHLLIAGQLSGKDLPGVPSK